MATNEKLTAQTLNAIFNYISQQTYPMEASDTPSGVNTGNALAVSWRGRTYTYQPGYSGRIDNLRAIQDRNGRAYVSNEDIGLRPTNVEGIRTHGPDNPTIGEAWLVSNLNSTLTFAGHRNEIAIRTRYGWEFLDADEGYLVLNKQTNQFMYRLADGTWQSGIPASQFAAGSIQSWQMDDPPLTIIQGVRFQPPPNPSENQAWIVSNNPPPTGAWAGRDHNIAIWVGGDWQFTVPTSGMTASNADTDEQLFYNGTNWVADVISTPLAVHRVFHLAPGAVSPSGTNNTSTTRRFFQWSIPQIVRYVEVEFTRDIEVGYLINPPFAIPNGESFPLRYQLRVGTTNIFDQQEGYSAIGFKRANTDFTQAAQTITFQKQFISMSDYSTQARTLSLHVVSPPRSGRAGPVRLVNVTAADGDIIVKGYK